MYRLFRRARPCRVHRGRRGRKPARGASGRDAVPRRDVPRARRVPKKDLKTKSFPHIRVLCGKLFLFARCGGKAPPVRRSRAHGRLRAKQYGGDAFASPPVDRCHLRHLPLHWSLAFPYVGKSHWKKLYLKILSLGFCRVVFGSRHFFEVEPQNKFREISESEAASFWINAEAPHSSSSCDAFFKANHGSRLSRILRDKVQSNLRSCLCVLLHAACVSRLIIRASVCPHM